MLTEADFRRLALGLPDTVESAHMGHPDFRVAGRIFATLWPVEGWGVVMLDPEQQAMLCTAEPAVFTPVPGGWGRGGSTRLLLDAADEKTALSALSMARARAVAKRPARPRRPRS